MPDHGTERIVVGDGSFEAFVALPESGSGAISYVLRDAGGGTELVGVHENVPPGVRPADNELGWSMSIGKLARLVEHDT